MQSAFQTDLQTKSKKFVGQAKKKGKIHFSQPLLNFFQKKIPLLWVYFFKILTDDEENLPIF